MLPTAKTNCVCCVHLTLRCVVIGLLNFDPSSSQPVNSCDVSFSSVTALVVQLSHSLELP